MNSDSPHGVLTLEAHWLVSWRINPECYAKVHARRLRENVPEMLAVVEAIRHADAMLDMVWNLYEFTTFGDSMLDLDWGGGIDD
jgi:hypothetical protein